MPRYAITERAGPFVAAYRNTGVGTVLDLTERQAEHELRLGTIVHLPEPSGGAAIEPQVDSPLDTLAPPEPSTVPDCEPEPDAAAPSRKQKRSAT
jgi:hypothetical protein